MYIRGFDAQVENCGKIEGDVKIVDCVKLKLASFLPTASDVDVIGEFWGLKITATLGLISILENL